MILIIMIFTGLEPVLLAWRAIVITDYTKRPLILFNFCALWVGVFSNLVFTSFCKKKIKKK